MFTPNSKLGVLFYLKCYTQDADKEAVNTHTICKHKIIFSIKTKHDIENTITFRKVTGTSPNMDLYLNNLSYKYTVTLNLKTMVI